VGFGAGRSEGGVLLELTIRDTRCFDPYGKYFFDGAHHLLKLLDLVICDLYLHRDLVFELLEPQLDLSEDGVGILYPSVAVVEVVTPLVNATTRESYPEFLLEATTFGDEIALLSLCCS
jgi:hypothetical protein